MNRIQSLALLTPENIVKSKDGFIVRNDNAELYNVSVSTDPEFYVTEYNVRQCATGIVHKTQFFANVVSFVTGAKPF